MFPQLSREMRLLKIIAWVWLPSALLGGCSDGRIDALLEEIPRGLTSGAPAPAYAARTLAGDSLRLSALQGQVVLLNVWATWCKPCLEEFPTLEALHNEFASAGLRVVGVSIDHEDPAELQRFLDQHAVSYLNLHDKQDRLEKTFGWGRGVPKSVLIDSQGRVAHFWSGGVPPANFAAREALRDTIRALLP